MKRAIMVLTAIIILPITQAHAGQFKIGGEHKYGCTDKDVYKKTVDMLADNDGDAFLKLMTAAISTGVCVPFTQGEPVFVTDAGIFMTKVRRKGDNSEYWTETQSLSSN